MDDVRTDALAFMSFLINSVKRSIASPNGRVGIFPNEASSVWREDLILLIITRETSVKSR